MSSWVSYYAGTRMDNGARSVDVMAQKERYFAGRGIASPSVVWLSKVIVS